MYNVLSKRSFWFRLFQIMLFGVMMVIQALRLQLAALKPKWKQL